MSERAEIQRRLVAHLAENSATWDWNLMDGSRDLPRGGKVRWVAFGVTGLLDAEILIWSPRKLTVRGQGPLAHAVQGEYKSIDELLAKLGQVEGRRRVAAATEEA